MPALAARMPTRLFAEWIEYETLEPFGAWRDNLHAATIACLLANQVRDVTKRPEPFTINDFMFGAETAAAEGAEEQMERELLASLNRASVTKDQAAAIKKRRGARK